MEEVAESHKAVLTTLQLLESGGISGKCVNSGQRQFQEQCEALPHYHNNFFMNKCTNACMSASLEKRNSPLNLLPFCRQVAETTCLLCEEIFKLDELNPILKHLVEEHRFVIAGVRMIADFKKYAEYWKKRLSEMPITHFCSVIETNTGPNDTEPKEKFSLLCDILPEDKALRERLQMKKLEDVLNQQAREREGVNFDRGCLFCKERYGSRIDLLNHMGTEHSFRIGKPDNIVYIEEFMDMLQDKLNKLQCLYCENTFKDRVTLKEHMRKKNHKRIKPSNQAYDKFYVINYLEFGKKWEEQLGDDVTDESPELSEPEDDWSDWRESADLRVVCLFCQVTAASSRDLLNHMTGSHRFDLDVVRERHHLTFYQQVKLINYIRRQVYHKCCIYCDVRCDTSQELMHHMASTDHFSQVPDPKTWDQPQYFFPTYEDDALLYALETADETEETTDCDVYAEDTPEVDGILRDYRAHKVGVESDRS